MANACSQFFSIKKIFVLLRWFISIYTSSGHLDNIPRLLMIMGNFFVEKGERWTALILCWNAMEYFYFFKDKDRYFEAIDRLAHLFMDLDETSISSYLSSL